MNPSEINLAGWGQQLGNHAIKAAIPISLVIKRIHKGHNPVFSIMKIFFPNPHFHNNGQNFC